MLAGTQTTSSPYCRPLEKGGVHRSQTLSRTAPHRTRSYHTASHSVIQAPLKTDSCCSPSLAPILYSLLTRIDRVFHCSPPASVYLTSLLVSIVSLRLSPGFKRHVGAWSSSIFVRSPVIGSLWDLGFVPNRRSIVISFCFSPASIRSS